MPRTNWNKPLLDKVRELADEGYGFSQICIRLNLKFSSLIHNAKKHRIRVNRVARSARPITRHGNFMDYDSALLRADHERRCQIKLAVLEAPTAPLFRGPF